MAASRCSRVAVHFVHALVAVFAAGAALIGSQAKADEAYACEDGRVVYVRFGELEAKKKSDPCVAAHYARNARTNRRNVEAPASAAEEAAPAQLPDVIAGDGAPPLPSRNSARLDQRSAVLQSVEIGPGPDEHVNADEAELKPRVEAVVFRHRSRRPIESYDAPSGPVDFRRVPILNARPGEPAVFNHNR